MEKEIGFAVKSSSFETYKKFKKDAEKIGWVYLYDFTPFNEEALYNINCLWFDKDWNEASSPDDFCFSFSSSSDGSLVFHIDNEDVYNEALQHVSNVYSDTIKLYYVVEKFIEDDDIFECLNGEKSITVYEIKNNTPVVYTIITGLNTDSTIDIIEKYLKEDNINKFELIEL